MSCRDEKSKPCLVCCSVLRKEIEHLTQQKKLDAQVIYVSKFFHVDYNLLEKNLRKILIQTIHRISKDVILVYGDLCLGPNQEMKQLANDYDVVKVDALNCLDCLFGGKGQIEKIDPNHEYMFMYPGMIEFFQDARERMKKEGISDEALRDMFAGIKGIIFLDTLEKEEKYRSEIESLNTGLTILETKKVNLDKLNSVIQEAIEKNASRLKY